MEPLETRFKFQASVARTQMFVSYVDRCRLRDLEVGSDLDHDHGAYSKNGVRPSGQFTINPFAVGDIYVIVIQASLPSIIMLCVSHSLGIWELFTDFHIFTPSMIIISL